jgi:hypothetical protein
MVPPPTVSSNASFARNPTDPTTGGTRSRRSSVSSSQGGDKPSAGGAGTATPPKGPKHNPLYKTSMCANWSANGSCPYHNRCQFAHGEEELKLWQTKRDEHKRAGGGAKKPAPEPNSAHPQAPETADLHHDDVLPAAATETHFSLFERSQLQHHVRRSSVPVLSSTELFFSPPGSVDSSNASVGQDRERANTYDNVEQLFVGRNLLPPSSLRELLFSPNHHPAASP